MDEVLQTIDPVSLWLGAVGAKRMNTTFFDGDMGVRWEMPDGAVLVRWGCGVSFAGGTTLRKSRRWWAAWGREMRAANRNERGNLL